MFCSYLPCIYLVSPVLWLLCELTVPCGPPALVVIEESSWFSPCAWTFPAVCFDLRFLLSPGRHDCAWVPRRPSPTAAAMSWCRLPMRPWCVNPMPACFQCVDSVSARMLHVGFFGVGMLAFSMSFVVVHNAECSCRSACMRLTP